MSPTPCPRDDCTATSHHYHTISTDGWSTPEGFGPHVPEDKPDPRPHAPEDTPDLLSIKAGTKLRIDSGWLVVDVGEHTCGGYGPESGYIHEASCGLHPLIQLDCLPGWPGEVKS